MTMAIFSLEDSDILGLVIRSSPFGAMSAPVGSPMITLYIFVKFCERNSSPGSVVAVSWQCQGVSFKVPVYRPVQYVTMNGRPVPAPQAPSFPVGPAAGAWSRQISTVSNGPPTEPMVSARPYYPGSVTPMPLKTVTQSASAQLGQLSSWNAVQKDIAKVG